MNTVVFVPFAASLLLTAASRVLVGRVRPVAAVWALSAAMPVLAASTVGALLVIACPLPARVPPVAALGQWAPGTVESQAPVAPALSLLALAGLAWLAFRLFREMASVIHEARIAVAAGALQRPPSGVVVVDDAAPHAHAVGVAIAGRGVVVVSSGLLRLLDAEERAAVLAHERAHLRHQHTLLAIVARVAAALNPLVAPARGDLAYAMERSADEAAVPAHGRDALASAIAKTALAEGPATAIALPGFGLHRHGVAARVAALLNEPAERARAAWALVALAAVAATALGWALHDTERFFETVRLLSRR